MAWLFYRTETDPVSPDGIFVKSGVSFRLYDGAGDTQPVGPVRDGPKYITLQIWQDLYPELIAPGSIIVPGNEGDLRNYSIVLGIEPKIKSIDLRPKANLKAHHTDLYQVEDVSRFILRRGQPFDVTVQFEVGGINTTCDEFLFVAEHDFDAEPVMIQIPITTELPEEGWGAKLLGEPVVDAEGRRTYQVRLTTPHDAPVGEWSFGAAVKRDGTEVPAVIKNFPAAVVLLFNPWNEADDVYMANEAEREETVMSESGFVFQADGPNSIDPIAYSFEQFKPSALKAALILLREAPASTRGSASSVTRFMTPLVNTQGPSRPPGAPTGVIEGRWPTDNDFAGGVDPRQVVDSNRVLDGYVRTGMAFKYGQCWNFAGVHTTLLRAIGVPARPVFAMEVGRKLATPPAVPSNELWYTYSQAPGGGWAPVRGPYDHLWDYHIWTEAWMLRPDRSDSGATGGWQALDATPLQPSIHDGFFGLGPAPVSAIRTGAGGDWDVSFLQMVLRGPIKPHIQIGGVWTPAQGSPAPAPVIVADATGPNVGFIDRLSAYKPNPLPPGNPVVVAVQPAQNVLDDFTITATLTNPHAVETTFDFGVRWVASSNGSTGPTGGSGSLITLQPSQSHVMAITIPGAEYWTFMRRWQLLQITAAALEQATSELYVASTVSALPTGHVGLSISPPGPFVVGNSFNVTATFSNPLPFDLTGASFFLSLGSSQVGGASHITEPVGAIPAGQTVVRTFTVQARFPDSEDQILGGLDSEEWLARADSIPVVIAPCVADWNEDEIVDALDFFAFLDIFTLLDESADLTGASDPADPGYGQPNGIVDTDDFFYFLDLFVVGCS
ncbi:MAG: hypothetical protein IT439_05555 [Phycisphaerales bacterium]|nr:hypothetical protein [Phycisphaerales bacterium]